MPQGRWYVYPIRQKLMEYDRKSHAELLVEARKEAQKNPLTQEHIERLREQMEYQNRWTWGVNNMKPQWERDGDE